MKNNTNILLPANDFYQALLFLAKSNMNSVFTVNARDNDASNEISEKARAVVNSLKKIKKVNHINLSKFTNICLELNMLAYMPKALKRLGRSDLLQLPDEITCLSEDIQEINPANLENNQLLHLRIEKQL